MKIRIISGAAALTAVLLMSGCQGELPFAAAKTPELSSSWTARQEIKFGDKQRQGGGHAKRAGLLGVRLHRAAGALRSYNEA